MLKSGSEAAFIGIARAERPIHLRFVSFHALEFFLA
jgi:hypothetical protein